MRSFQILLLCLIPAIAGAGEIEIDGTYQGENLYVNNPYASSGVGFCVYEVMVNGMTTTDEINSSAFEIDLAVFRFTIGDPLEVTIRYKEGCEPAVINPEVISPRATFKTIDIALDDNILKWESSNETGSLPFFVEQYRWNKWVQVGKVQGRGNPGKHHYGMPVRLHSGENRIRVRQVDDRNVRKLSPEVIVVKNQPEVTLVSGKVEENLVFTEPTLYEVYDISGRIVFKGFGDTISVGGLETGEYYLNYDNRMSGFLKK
jgi:hypothetical protein